MTVPLVKLPFKPYHDKEFNIDVTTEQEDHTCDLFRDANQEQVTAQFKCLKSLVARDENIVGEPQFVFLMRIIRARRSILLDAGEWKNNLTGALKELAAAMHAESVRSVPLPQPQIQQQPIFMPQQNVVSQVCDWLGPFGSLAAGWYIGGKVFDKPT